MNSIKSSISKKHLIAIAVVIAMGVGAGALILQGGKTKAAAGEGDGHGHGTHTEAKGHGDGEHHGKADGKGHDDDKGHADGEHHEKSESKGTNGGSLFKEGDFGLETLLAEDGGEPRLRGLRRGLYRRLAGVALDCRRRAARPLGHWRCRALPDRRGRHSVRTARSLKLSQQKPRHDGGALCIHVVA